MNILILNWRDIKNPSGGGAEILTHEMAKRWVEKGNTVTQFSSTFHKYKQHEVVDGITFIRKGKWWTVHIYAFFYYLKHRKAIDVVIDEVHWFPFFSALYAPKKTIAFTCEVASKLFFTIAPYPVALFFFLLEKIYLYLYREVPTMVISQSTYKDLLAAGYSKKNLIILPMGLTIPTETKILQKEKNPTIISVGRLNRQKGTIAVIEAFSLIKKTIPKAILWLVGSGDEAFVRQLKEKIKEYRLKDSVILYGFVSEKEKFALLSRAHILISASVQEGWGLTIPEAGLMKTPAVVYDIHGFRDIIEHNKNGLLVKENPSAIADGTISLLENKTIYKKIQAAIYTKAKLYSWDTTAEKALQFIKKHEKSDSFSHSDNKK